MTIKEIKKELLSYEDFYGGDISDTEAVENAKTKKELADVIQKHRDFMTDMLSDALSHLRELEARTGLDFL